MTGTLRGAGFINAMEGILVGQSTDRALYQNCQIQQVLHADVRGILDSEICSTRLSHPHWHQHVWATPRIDKVNGRRSGPDE